VTTAITASTRAPPAPDNHLAAAQLAGTAGPNPATSTPRGGRLTFDFEWAELPDDIAHRKQQA
jgi:hypothetical protein